MKSVIRNLIIIILCTFAGAGLIMRFGGRTDSGEEEAAASSVSDYGEESPIRVLDTDAFEKLRQKCSSTDFDPDALTLGGSAVPCDEDSQTFYVPRNISDADWEVEGSVYFLSDEELDNLSDAMQDSHAFTCLIVQGRTCFQAKVVFTGLPIVTIHYEGSEPTEEKEVHEGTFALFDPDRKEVVGTPCTFHVRGNTSSLFDKKNYKVSLTRANGSKYKQSLLGMREDDDWILNAVYQDDTHIREKVATDLWNQVNDLEETPVYTSHMEFVEVFLNDEYRGLYCLQEPVDKKQLGLQNGDILYKVKDWAEDHGKSLHPCVLESDFERAEGTDELDSSDGWVHAQVKFPKSSLPNSIWDPFHTYFDFVYNDLSYEDMLEQGVSIDWDNAAVYHLFTLVTNAEDNIWKNVYVAAERLEDGYTIRSDIWDLNYTFGNVFYYPSGDTPMDTRYMRFDASTVTKMQHAYNLTYTYESLEKYDSERADSLLKEKYAKWRESGISADSLCEAADECLSEIKDSGALTREESRWPGYEIEDGVEDMEEWMRSRMEFLDEYFAYGGD